MYIFNSHSLRHMLNVYLIFTMSQHLSKEMKRRIGSMQTSLRKDTSFSLTISESVQSFPLPNVNLKIFVLFGAKKHLI